MIAEINSWYGWLPGIISSLIGGGLAASYVALYKVKPEAGQIVVTAAQGALVVQTGVIENLRKELKRVQEEADQKIATLERALIIANQEIASLHRTIQGMQRNQTRHDSEVKDLQDKHK